MRMDMNDFLNKVSGEVVDVITEFIEDNFDTEDFSEQDMGGLPKLSTNILQTLQVNIARLWGRDFSTSLFFLCMENCGDIMEFVDHMFTT